jgi:replicative DNA helicase
MARKEEAMSQYVSNDDPLTMAPPSATRTEQSVLGTMLCDQIHLLEGLKFLGTGDFYRTVHQLVFAALEEMVEKGLEVDIITVSEYLKQKKVLDDCGGRSYISELAISCQPNELLLWTNLKILRDHRIRRDIIKHGWQSVSLAHSEYDVPEILGAIEQSVINISDSSYESKDIQTMPDLIIDFIDDFYTSMANPNTERGFYTRWHELDLKLNGLQNGNLIVVAARPSMGKTTFLLNMIEESAVNQQIPSLLFSMEMTASEVTRKLISSMAKVEYDKILKGDCHDTEKMRIFEAAEHLKRCPLRIDDTSMMTPGQLRVKTKKQKIETKGQLGFVGLDYLQLMSGEGKENRVQEISEITRYCKSVAKDLNLPMVALSQLNREVEKRTNKRPLLSDLRESGSIEQDADIIMMLYREEYYLKAKTPAEDIGIAEVIIAKHRMGQTDNVKLKFKGAKCRFENLVPIY